MYVTLGPEQEATKKQEAELARVHKDRGMGEPVHLVPGGKREAVASGRGVEVSLDHGDTEDSDDLPEEEEHRGTNGDSHHSNHINTVIAISRFILSCSYCPVIM